LLNLCPSIGFGPESQPQHLGDPGPTCSIASALGFGNVTWFGESTVFDWIWVIKWSTEVHCSDTWLRIQHRYKAYIFQDFHTARLYGIHRNKFRRVFLVTNVKAYWKSESREITLPYKHRKLIPIEIKRWHKESLYQSEGRKARSSP